MLGEWVEEDIAAGSPILRTANEARAPQHPARDAHSEGSRRLHDYLHETADHRPADDSTELTREIRAAVDELRPDYRAVFVLFHEQGQAYEEIAEAIDRVRSG